MEDNLLNKNPYLEGKILLVDKPLNWTSFDVVNKLRYVLKDKYKLKKIKVGHAGTLDPLASGLVVICTGRMTKSIQQFLTADKVYEGKIKLGATTPSYDLETQIDSNYSVDHIDQGLVDSIIDDFTGELDQIPPIFSAKRIKGKRAYEYARNNEKIELKPQKVTIKKLNLKITNKKELEFSCQCSKGTYIRSLARDIGFALKSGGHLIELRRIASGNFIIESAKTVEEWIHFIETQ